MNPASADSVTLPGIFLEPRSTPPASPGEILGDRYVVGEQLGRGGGGLVFRAWDRRTSTAVALKLLLPGLAARPAWTRRLAREMSLARRIRHPNVCSILDYHESHERPFIVMELAEGSLCDERERAREGAGAEPRPRVDWTQRAHDARDACRGLAAIHEAGIVHRDIKPGNVLRMADGRLVVADFGMAVAAGESITFGGGTPNYLPPEVTLGEPHDLRSDVWQLGIVLHEILLGARPTFRPDGNGPWAPLIRGRLPRAVAPCVRVAARCLSWNPAARPADASAVARSLEP